MYASPLDKYAVLVKNVVAPMFAWVFAREVLRSLIKTQTRISSSLAVVGEPEVLRAAVC
jgi:hypothetical protein